MMVAIKRVYDPVSGSDGFRVLVDRTWPRGISKQEAAIDLWAKDAAPSNELRKWFNHEPERWEGFRKRYRKELSQGGLEALQAVLRGKKKVTLLYGAKDTVHNQAVVLHEALTE